MLIRSLLNCYKWAVEARTTKDVHLSPEIHRLSKQDDDNQHGVMQKLNSMGDFQDFREMEVGRKSVERIQHSFDDVVKKIRR